MILNFMKMIKFIVQLIGLNREAVCKASHSSSIKSDIHQAFQSLESYRIRSKDIKCNPTEKDLTGFHANYYNST